MSVQSALRLLAASASLLLLVGCRSTVAGGSSAAPVPAKPAAESTGPGPSLLGGMHAPLYALHGVDAASPEAFAALSAQLTASDLVRVTDAAIRAELTSVSAAPNDPKTLSRVADLLTQERRYGLASFFLDRAAALAPDDPNVFYDLGNALLSFERPSLAIEAFDRAAALDPGSGHVWERLARACLAEGRLREKSVRNTRLALQKTVDLDAREDARLWAATALVRLDMAEGTYNGPAWDKVGADGKPEGIGPLRVRTNEYYERALLTREPAERIELLAEAVARDPEHIAAVIDLARELLDAGRFEEAIPRFEEARRLGAESAGLGVADAMAGEAICLAALDRGNDADALARAAVAADEDSPFARYAHARVAWLAGDAELAMARCREALERWPEHSGALALMGRCLDSAGESELARRALTYAQWAEASPTRRDEIGDLLKGLDARKDGAGAAR